MAPGGEALTAKNFQLEVDDDKAVDENASISHAHLTNPQNLSFNYREQNGHQVYLTLLSKGGSVA